MTDDAHVAYWAGDAGARWARHRTTMDRVLAPVGAPTLSTARAVAGERVLDVGCGCGASTRALGRRVGARGSVLGVDVSAPMIVTARSRAMANVDFLVADAAQASFEKPFDLVFSRFGTMFFADPVRAFAHLRRATAPGGRLVFCAWRRIEDNPWAHVVESAIAPHLPMTPRGGGGGPFSMARRAVVRAVLEEAGWTQILIRRHDALLPWTRGPSVERAARLFTRIGPVATRLASAEPAAKRLALASLAGAFAAHTTARGLMLGSSSWIVTAFKA